MANEIEDAGWIQDYGGKKVSLTNPQWQDIDFNTVAHVLGNIPRFNGHTKEFWPVAFHTYIVSMILAEVNATLVTQYYGLHHDDSEAYICDIPSPLKRSIHMSEYRAIESMHMGCVITALDLGGDIIDYEAVKQADLAALAAEGNLLLNNPPIENWTNNVMARTTPEMYDIAVKWTNILKDHLHNRSKPKEMYLYRHEYLKNEIALEKAAKNGQKTNEEATGNTQGPA